MAEAHNAAVAFQFALNPDGTIQVNVDRQVFTMVWRVGVHAWHKRMEKVKNYVMNGCYPATSWTWLVTLSVLAIMYLLGVPFLGFVHIFTEFKWLSEFHPVIVEFMAIMVLATIVWLGGALIGKLFLRFLLSQHFWMYEPIGRPSVFTKALFMIVKVLCWSKPNLLGYQQSLPRLSVPKYKDTVERYVRSMKAILNDEQYAKLVVQANDFMNTQAARINRWLRFQSWITPNYVSAWWEKYVYLRNRSPLMVNSNYYAVDTIYDPMITQAARAANLIYALIQFRRQIEREYLKPLLIQKVIPLCSNQYQRMFNTTRIPGVECDRIEHFFDSSHIVVYSRGRYYKLFFRIGGRHLLPCELEQSLEYIIADKSLPCAGEEHLAALTAGSRVPWAKARSQFFSSGVNKVSLDAVERGAFFLALDDTPQSLALNNAAAWDKYSCAMLYGKCHDRWFDKSVTLIITSNGRLGINCEHAWADAPICGHMLEFATTQCYLVLGADAPVTAHMWEFMCNRSRQLGYDEHGHTMGIPTIRPPVPARLKWALPSDCINVIEASLTEARALAKDVDMHMFIFQEFGKGLIKKFKVSPDAFLQMALQLTFFKDQKEFCQTYEASMTRLYKAGRTETVRSCSVQSCEFVKAMLEHKKSDGDLRQSPELLSLFRKACEAHVRLYKDAMTGHGVDRHIFCMSVVSAWLKLDLHPFLKSYYEVPWKLSTSQTPSMQTDRVDYSDPKQISTGGGFGPVSDEGYGVSYIIAGEHAIGFHISSRHSCKATDSHRFGRLVRESLSEMSHLLQ